MKKFTLSASAVFVWIMASILLFSSCSKTDTPVPVKALDSLKQIVSFSLKKADGTAFTASELTIAITGTTITITVPADADRSQLKPEITINGVSISPLSGVTQDFTNPVVYTVTAEDGSHMSYSVIVENAVATLPAGTVYIGCGDNHFYALDALTGALKWSYPGTQSFAYSGATYASGTVYVGGIDSYVYAFEANTGAVKWKFQAGPTGIESDAVVVDGAVYVGCNDDYLYALDAATGTLKWKFLTGANVSASPTILNGVVYFGSSDNNLYALDAANGNLKWSYATGAMINQSGPALVNGAIFVGSRDGYLYSIDAAAGTLNWRFSSDNISFEMSSPTVVNGIVYIASWYDIGNFSRAGSLYAVNAATGEKVWEALPNIGFSSSPTVADGRLYITADDGMLHAINAATGGLLWQKTIYANSTSASPAVANGIVYSGGGGSRYIYAFDAVDGTEKWRFGIPNGLNTSSPLIVNASGQATYAGNSGLMY